MIKKLRQYKNLILLALAVILLIGLILSDPLGYCAKRFHDRAAIRNQMAIERAETEKQIAVIKAQTEAERKRIERGLELTLESSGGLPAPEENTIPEGER